MKALKILIVTEFFPPHIGGVETFFFELRKALIKRGHHVDIITSSQKGAAKFEDDGHGEIYRVPVPQGFERYAFTFFGIPQTIKHAQYADIIHTTTYNAALPAWIASKIWRKSSVLSVHEVLGEDWIKVTNGSSLKASIFRFIEWTILKLNFDRYVAVSKFTQNRLPKKLKKKSAVVYHGIDSIFKPGKKAERKHFEFLYFGRAAYNKGLWFMLKALPNFKVDNVDFNLMVSGSQEEIARIKDFIKENNLKNIRLTKPVVREELPNVIRSASAVVIPSLAEGFGFTTAESCACGIPVVVSDAGALPEVVSGKHLIFKSGSEEELLKALEKAVKGEWKHSKEKNFSWDQAAEEFEKIYKSLLNMGA